MLTGGSSRLVAVLPTLVHEPWLALPLAGLVAAGFGILFGLPSIRARGEYLAIVTLALGEIVPALVIRFPDLTSGARGISGIAPPRRCLACADGSPLHAYLLALVLAAGVWLVRLAAGRRTTRAGLGRRPRRRAGGPLARRRPRRPSSWWRSRWGPAWPAWPARCSPGWSATSSRSSST